jgi:hypothetical protein
VSLVASSSNLRTIEATDLGTFLATFSPTALPMAGVAGALRLPNSSASLGSLMAGRTMAIGCLSPPPPLRAITGSKRSLTDER